MNSVVYLKIDNTQEKFDQRKCDMTHVSVILIPIREGEELNLLLHTCSCWRIQVRVPVFKEKEQNLTNSVLAAELSTLYTLRFKYVLLCTLTQRHRDTSSLDPRIAPPSSCKASSYPCLPCFRTVVNPLVEGIVNEWQG